MYKSLFQATLLLCLSSWTGHASPLSRRQLLLPPDQDPFYTPPAGYESTAPGTILATREPPAPIAVLGTIPIVLADSQQILYRSTDSFGNPSATVTTVLVPENANTSRLLAYQVAQDSAFLNCAPSYAFQLASDSGGPLGTVGTQIEILGIGAALAEGWVVTVADHEGPNAAFLANTRGGQHVLDAIRATLSSSLADPAADVAMWGYSGGSLVSSFAAELAPTYAPELASNLIGVVLGGAVPNITSSLPLINSSPFSGLLPGGIIGLANEYPDVATVLDEYLIPEREEDFRQAETQCFGANLVQFLGQDVLNDYFLNASYFFFEDPTIVGVQDANAMGQRIPEIPVFMYKGVLDQISDVEDTDELYEFYCDGGASVEYIRDLSAEHAGLLITGIPSAIQWIKERFEGDNQQGCTRRDVVTSLIDAAAQALENAIRDALEGFLGLSEIEIMAK